MAAKMKENGYRIPGQSESVAENIVQESQQAVRKEKVKKSAGTANEKSMLIPETNWTQEQQRALEAAIVKYRKTAGGGDRWQKIANSVPEKTKEECLVRYKYLCELVKTQKKAEEEEEEEAEADEAAVPAEAEEQEQEEEEVEVEDEATAPAIAPPARECLCVRVCMCKRAGVWRISVSINFKNFRCSCTPERWCQQFCLASCCYVARVVPGTRRSWRYSI